MSLNATKKIERSCDWCGFRSDYESFPDGSLASNGWLACGPCMDDPKVLRAMEMVHFARVLESED